MRSLGRKGGRIIARKEQNDRVAGKGPERTREDRQIRNVALSAFVLNLGLAAVKGWLAYESGSLAVTAGAIDSASDSVASLAMFAGVLLSTRKTRSFPMGLYKIENLISVIVALFIFFAGYEIATRLIGPPQKPPEITMPLLYWLLGCTAAIFLFGKFALYIGQRTGSPALIAEGSHRQVDVLSSLVVMVSVLLNFYGIEFRYYFFTIDRIAAALVLIFIVKAGWELLFDGMRVLLDASLDYRTLDEARNIIEMEPGVKKVKSITGRSAGRFRFLSADITLRTEDLKKAHLVADRLEEKLKKEIPNVERVMLHYEPAAGRVQRIAFPVLEDGDTICEHFGESPFFAILEVRTRDGEVERKTILENPHSDIGRGKGIQTARFLVEHRADKVWTKKDMQQSGPGYVFSDAGVETLEVSQDSAEGAVRERFGK